VYLPVASIVEARRLIRSGAIGKVAFARVRASHSGPASMTNWPTDPSWFYQKGSGPLFDVGVYGIHELLGLLGPARRVSAMSGMTEPTRTVRSGPFAGTVIDVTADDNTLILLDFGDSTFAIIDATFNVNAASGPRLEVFGREGTLNVPNNTNVDGGRGVEVFRLDAVSGLSGWISPRCRDGQARPGNHAQGGRGRDDRPDARPGDRLRRLMRTLDSKPPGCRCRQ
jgi:predicted dehydrogenase